MHIVQVVPFIGSGSGVGGVAWNLQREFRAMGITVESFTLTTARRRPDRFSSEHRILRAIELFRRMVWFTTVGTVRARRFLAARPDAVSICHNGAMVGDIYVNHGVVSASMRARGNALWRMLRNPTHIFTFVRDTIRYRSRIHQAVVALSPSEAHTLRRVYGKVRPEIVVIPNGVDLTRFHPPTPAERTHAREAFLLEDDARVVLFVGHEFARKGLDHAIQALVHAPSVLLLVVGGDSRSIPAAHESAVRLGVVERVLFLGRRGDLPELFAAADIFVLPSAYEANALVVLEALAAGLPVVCTPVGYATQVVVDGENGYLVNADPREIGARLAELAAADLSQWRSRARVSVRDLGWRDVAERYVALVDEIRGERAGREAGV